MYWWRPIETAPKDEEVMFWIRPLTKDEAWCNTSGQPIVVDSPPQLFVGKHGRWSSLWTATHWLPLPAGPRLETVPVAYSKSQQKRLETMTGGPVKLEAMGVGTETAVGRCIGQAVEGREE